MTLVIFSTLRRIRQILLGNPARFAPPGESMLMRRSIVLWTANFNSLLLTRGKSHFSIEYAIMQSRRVIPECALGQSTESSTDRSN